MSKNAEAAIKQYLVKQNRPYSAIDITNNLHKEFGKTLVERTLEALSDSGQIVKKIYGKQKVFCADQSAYPDVDDTELKSMDAQVNQLTDSLKKEQHAFKERQSKLHSLNSSLTTDQAQQQLNQLKKECSRYSEKLHQLKNNANAVSPEERAQIMTVRTRFVKEWRKRKRIAMDISNAVLEGYPKSKKEFFEEVGIETDEEYNVKPPEL